MLKEIWSNVIKMFGKKEEQKQEHLNLRVGELLERQDFGRGIARIDSTFMKQIDVEDGSIIEILSPSKSKTGAVALHSYSDDVGKNIIRIDGLVRRNCDVSIGDDILVRKADVREAKKVVLAPAQKGYVFHTSPNLLKQNIFMRPMKKGDIIIANPVFKTKGKGEGKDKSEDEFFSHFFGIDIEEVFMPMGSEMRLVVEKTEPEGVVQITDMTEVKLISERKEPMTETEEDLSPERIVNVKTLPSLKKMLEVTTIDEIAKLSKDYRITKYEDDKQTVYFVGNWYFRKLKKGLK